MGKKRRKLREPERILEKLPPGSIISLTGGRLLRCEGHRGVLEYTDEHILLSLSPGRLSVFGSGLSIAAMNERDILIRGRIKALELEEGRGEN